MQIRGDVSARLLHLIFALFLGGVVYLLARRALKVKNAWLSLLFLFSTPLVLVLAAWAYNDLALAFYTVAALFAFVRWDETDNDRWLVVCGLLAGFLMGIKYTSVVVVIFLTIAILWRQRQKPEMKPLLYFLVPAGALVAPWLLKNWLFTGNPVYPFLFGGRFWDGFRAAGYSEAGTGIGLDPVALLRLPYEMTLGYADASQEGTIGPFYLLFLPMFLFYGFTGARKRAPRALRFLLIYALFSYLFWAFGVISSSALYQARLMVPGLVALCPVLAWMMEDLSRYDHPQFSLRRFLNLALIFVVALLLLGQFTSWLRINPISYLSGTETRSAFLQRTLGPHYQIMETINARLPSDAVVQFLWEPRSYYCDLDCRPDAILDRFDHSVFLYQNSESIAAAWRANGVTHVLIFEAGLNFLLNAGADIDHEILQSLMNDYMIAIDTPNNAYSLYQLQTDHE
jgi:4-amino-4-deoxy-L-arabinose transferase-like glycosyltransferase